MPSAPLLRTTVALAFVLSVILAGCTGERAESLTSSVPGGEGDGGDVPPTLAATADSAKAVRELHAMAPYIPPGPVEPAPLHVTAALDEGRAVSRLMPASGGTIEATAADGTRFVLTVPPLALLEETTITMTPVSTLDFSVPDTDMAGVRLEPEGLRFYDWATLEVFPADGDVARPALAYSANLGDGFHGRPLEPLGDRLVVKVLHFTIYTVHIGQLTTSPLASPPTGQPVRWDSQLEQAAQDLFARERQAQIDGTPGDPAFAEKLGRITDKTWEKVIQPLLARMKVDCRVAHAEMHTALGFMRMSQMWGLADAAREDAVATAVSAALDTCWKKMMADCFDPQDPADVQRVLSLARQAALLGEGGFDVDHALDPDNHPSCPSVTGNLVYRSSEEVQLEGGQKTTMENAIVHVRMKKEGGRLVDMGSTASWTGNRDLHTFTTGQGSWDPGYPSCSRLDDTSNWGIAYDRPVEGAIEDDAIEVSFESYGALKGHWDSYHCPVDRWAPASYEHNDYIQGGTAPDDDEWTLATDWACVLAGPGRYDCSGSEQESDEGYTSTRTWSGTLFMT